MVFKLWKSHMRSTSFLGSFPNVASETFQCSSDWRWPYLVLLRKIVQRFLFPRLSPPGDRWSDALGFVHTGSVSSISTLQTFRDSSHLWWLLCPPVYLLGHFPLFHHVQGSTPAGVFKCKVDHLHMPVWTSHSTFHFLRQAHWICEDNKHVWSDCRLLMQSSGGHGWLLLPPLSSWSLYCLHGWWPHLAWHWRPTLTEFWVTEPSVYTMRSCGFLISENTEQGETAAADLSETIGQEELRQATL